MSNDYCHFCFIGRLTKDAELKYTANGTPITNFSMAVNKRISKDKEHVNFFDVILWGNYGVALEKYLGKGQQVQVAGEIKQERWQDKTSGNTRSKIIFVAKDLQLLGTAKGSGTSHNNNGNNENFNNEDPYQNDNGYDDNDDIPF